MDTMRELRFTLPCLATLVVGLGACSDNKPVARLGGEPDAAGNAVTLAPSDDDDAKVQGALIDAEKGDTIYFAKGEYHFRNQLSLAASEVTLKGAADTVFDFTDQVAGANGLEVTGNDDVIDTLRIQNTKGDGLRVTQVDGVTIRNVHVEWTGGPNTNNGGYGIYPVTSKRILVEKCFASGASDTGIYVGQSSDIVLRNNEVTGNVAGIEVENSTDAEVYGNHAHDNSGGILLFNLPGLTVKDGKRANVHDNIVENNNGMNFAATGNIVHDVPPGTGMFVLASDGNEIHDNKVMGNQSVGVAILSWFVTLRDPEGHADPEFDWYPEGNFVHDNDMKDNGKDPLERAKLIAGIVGIDALSDVAWDGIVDGSKIYGDAGTPDAGVPASDIPSQLLNCFLDDGSTFLDLDLEHDGRAKTQDRSVYNCEKPSLSPVKL
jgi:parallel beta-helix repeat protein